MRLLFSFFLTFILASQMTAQGIDFFHGTWKEALRRVPKNGQTHFRGCLC